jgi:hypothetical protein
VEIVIIVEIGRSHNEKLTLLVQTGKEDSLKESSTREVMPGFTGNCLSETSLGDEGTEQEVCQMKEHLWSSNL